METLALSHLEHLTFRRATLTRKVTQGEMTARQIARDLSVIDGKIETILYLLGPSVDTSPAILRGKEREHRNFWNTVHARAEFASV